VKTIITAAGQSSRLWESTGREPKTLLPFGDASILAAILGNFAQIGVREFVLVTGYRGDLIAEHLRDNDNFGVTVELLENAEWHRGNGLSVQLALAHLAPEEPVLLSMADHVVSPRALAAIRDAPADTNLLLVDPRIGQCFDLETPPRSGGRATASPTSGRTSWTTTCSTAASSGSTSGSAWRSSWRSGRDARGSATACGKWCGTTGSAR